ncbi:MULTISPECIES: SDR family NAD(P)-dependent oxidoreductase [Pseudoalteromonas]|uniref:SDR family NAD(P)-dependent oxidoreductase n=1 Tax=Pseudoalteromonas TaxID=53246 RepID=UPI00158231D4|nr:MULTISPECIES: SDR family NAD(P)-dependent oxidoreductase [Pseudoalteromonas]MDI4654294.1 SDR family NAD(P)-dependent oxidoreductase [Pseudoalteromonas shioyasakiensis]NUJ40642.1 SDR family NAD(P)-dependent oxidoreductase [Pseudoalteromonas sp. 0303]
MKVVVVTGTSRRLGKFLVEHFLKMNYQVISISRNKEAISQLHINSHLDHYQVDGYFPETAKEVAYDILEKYDSIDLIVHNASKFISDDKDIDNYASNYQEMINVHMIFPSLLNSILYPALKEAPEPNIIQITDIYVDNPNENFSLYCSTKSGLESLTKSFAKKFAPHIRVNSIQPGPIKFLSTHNESEKESVLNEALIKREGGFDSILKTINFITENNYITGSSVKVDGGRSLNR